MQAVELLGLVSEIKSKGVIMDDNQDKSKWNEWIKVDEPLSAKWICPLCGAEIILYTMVRQIDYNLSLIHI